MKNKKPLLIVLGEPNSVFVEILSKVFRNYSLKKKINYPIILIGSKKLFLSQLKLLKKKLLFQTIEKNDLIRIRLKKKIYFLDVHYNFKKAFDKISAKSRRYIDECFSQCFNILYSKNCNFIINGPVSKKHFLKKKYPGVTEYIFDKSKKKLSYRPVMLLYNKTLSVSPITTHIPLKKVSKNINKKIIINNASTIDNFYRKYLKRKPKIAILGLNPHCETNSMFNEDDKIIKPTVKTLKEKNINITGPFPSDTFFLKKNIEKYDCVIGMYHDQVLTPFKTLFGFDASNITLGLPFLRLSVDHGPNERMMGKNISNTKSLENIIKFVNLTK